MIYIGKEMLFVSFVLSIFTICGIKDTVVNTPDIKPITVVATMLFLSLFYDHLLGFPLNLSIVLEPISCLTY